MKRKLFSRAAFLMIISMGSLFLNVGCPDIKEIASNEADKKIAAFKNDLEEKAKEEAMEAKRKAENTEQTIFIALAALSALLLFLFIVKHIARLSVPYIVSEENPSPIKKDNKEK